MKNFKAKNTTKKNVVNKKSSKPKFRPELKKDRLADKKLFKNIKGVMYVGGYHYGYKIQNIKQKDGSTKQHFQPYIDMNKEYNFKIAPYTHHLSNWHLGQEASVNTKKGKGYIVVSKLKTVTGSVAIQMVKKLKPVLNFEPFKLTSKSPRFKALYEKYTKPVIEKENK